MYAHLHATLEKLSGHRVLCVGDVMLDRFVYGQVERISPEAPVPVFRVERESVSLGGCGNVVRNVTALGGQADMIAVVGQDQAGYDLTAQIAAFPEIASYVITDAGRATTLKTRYVADGQHLLRADTETATPVSSSIEEQVLVRVKAALEACAVVVLSDYAKGLLTSNVVSSIVELCAAKGKPVLIDPKGRDFSRYARAFMLTPNRKELHEATGRTIATVEDACAAARQLIDAYELGSVLAKLGGDGVCLVTKDGETRHFHTAAREVYDVSGAGDTVVATMALALAGGVDRFDAAALANVAGTIVVGKVGTATVSSQDLAQELLQHRAGGSAHKILSPRAAAERAEAWRMEKLKVGFTNGCFDLLHPGHLSLIAQARAACDRLIVGMNSDASVKRLKGTERPIQDEDARALVLSSLADVDAVVVFEEDTPYDLIKALRPDVLVKGADYTIETVVGSDVVQSYGGKVLLASLVEGKSTTAMVKKIKTVCAS